MSYENDFWPKIVIIAISSVSISCISVIWKKALEKYKDYKIQKNINVNLEPQNYSKAAAKLASVTSKKSTRLSENTADPRSETSAVSKELSTAMTSTQLTTEIRSEGKILDHLLNKPYVNGVFLREQIYLKSPASPLN